MAIQPSIRPAGSSHLLRFVGTLLTSPDADISENAVVPQGAIADTQTSVIFALADMTDLTDMTKRLPGCVFDDSAPAGSAPHANTLANMGPGVTTPTGKTYAQNIRVRAHERTGSTASPLIARIDYLMPLVEIDGPPLSNLGLMQNTGIPCVILSFYFTAAGITALAAQEDPGIEIVVEIEVPHSLCR